MLTFIFIGIVVKMGMKVNKLNFNCGDNFLKNVKKDLVFRKSFIILGYGN